MEMVSIGLERLIAHPGNANVMKREDVVKLKKHIAEHGFYEPLVVRRHPVRAGDYELINGHHRKEVLGELGHTAANCVVWDLTDEQTLMVLATINRLGGHDEPRLRGELLEKLSQRYDVKMLLGRLPETKAQLEKVMAGARRVQVVRPEAMGEMRQTMVFFVTKQQKQIVEQALRAAKARAVGDDVEQKMGRGDLLACVAAGYRGNRE